MVKYFHILGHVSLFEGITGDGLESMLHCLGAEKVRYAKNAAILFAGERPTRVGVVLEGNVHIVKDDINGNRSIIAALGPGNLFGEALCCAGVEESPVSVLADNETTVLSLEFSRILHTCPRSCEFHRKLIENMLAVVARKNLFLQSRVELAALKSVRAKVMAYLGGLAAEQGRHITVPINREEMADYLFVERSALSHELMKMKGEGLIKYHKNHFELL